MNSEKVKEIKKAIEWCNIDVDCDGCPYYAKKDCIKTKNKDILTLINELESENEKLKQHKRELEGGQRDLLKVIKEFDKETQQLKDRIAELEKENDTLKNRITCKIVFPDEKLEEIKKRCIERVYADVKDTLKQFAERLKEKCNDKNAFICSNSITATEIDETLKEFINE